MMSSKMKSGKKKSANKGSRPAAKSRRTTESSARRSRASVMAGIPRNAGGARLSAIPTMVGASMPRAFFGMGGRAQVLSDFDPDQSLRVTGRDLFYTPVTGGAAGQGFDDAYYVAVAPTEVSARLANVEAIFERFAIRSLRIFYAPATGSTSTVQVALGYTGNANMGTIIAAPTQTQTMEFQSAALFPAWQPAQLEMKHTGTRTWLTSSTMPVAAPWTDYFQGLLVGTLLNGVDETVYGQLWIEYVVDFYAPCPILTGLTHPRVSDFGGLQIKHRSAHASLVASVDRPVLRSAFASSPSPPRTSHPVEDKKVSIASSEDPADAVIVDPLPPKWSPAPAGSALPVPVTGWFSSGAAAAAVAVKKPPSTKV